MTKTCRHGPEKLSGTNSRDLVRFDWLAERLSKRIWTKFLECKDDSMKNRDIYRGFLIKWFFDKSNMQLAALAWT
jgi:hypothetical protein